MHTAELLPIAPCLYLFMCFVPHGNNSDSAVEGIF